MKQVVCLSTEPWSPTPGRTQHLITRLKDAQVLYFSPSGIPVATVAINGAKNAAVLAAQILSVSDDVLAAKLDAAREKMAEQIAAKEAKLQAEL